MDAMDCSLLENHDNNNNNRRLVTGLEGHLALSSACAIVYTTRRERLGEVGRKCIHVCDITGMRAHFAGLRLVA